MPKYVLDDLQEFLVKPNLLLRLPPCFCQRRPGVMALGFGLRILLGTPDPSGIYGDYTRILGQSSRERSNALDRVSFTLNAVGEGNSKPHYNYLDGAL